MGAGLVVGPTSLAGPDSGAQLEMTRDLAADAASARAARLPVMLVVTREDCAYCARLKRQVLSPMLQSGDYSDSVLMRELVIDPVMPVTDFDGRQTDSAAIAERLDATLSPTILLLDPLGRSLEPPIRGISNLEFYGYYLDAAIARALAALRAANGKGD
jgi:thioredoxin-related protein